MNFVKLRYLIRLAWDLEGTDSFDIIAKTPEGMQLGALNGPLDIEPLQLMLKNLLIQRFKLKTHTEDRPTRTC
jgi:uncharacterized protein (TIGR03435 family)